jgi:hypothetical protein
MILVFTCFLIFTIRVLHQSEMSANQFLVAFGLSVLLALAVTVYIARTQDIFRPPKERVPRKSWSRWATANAFLVAMGVLYTTWWLWGFLLLALSYLAALVLSFPEGTPIILLFLTIPVPLLLALLAFIAWRYATLEILETVQPPELRLATNLIRYADEFQQRARGLEQAIEEAAVISKQLQSGIELEQQRLSELHEDNLRQSILRKLNTQEVSAIDFALTEAQTRSARRSRWWNVAFAVVGWAVGLATQALIDTDALGDQLRQWLPLG